MAPLGQDLWCPRCVQTDPDPTSAATEGLGKTGTHGRVSSPSAPTREHRVTYFLQASCHLSFRAFLLHSQGFSSIYSPKIGMVLHLRALSSPLYSAQLPIQRHCRKIHNLNVYKIFLKKYTLIFSLKNVHIKKRKMYSNSKQSNKSMPF